MTKSSFTSPADLRMLDNYTFELLQPFCYHVGNFPSLHIVHVPAGFVTDLASIPRVLWSLLPPHGEYAKAAIIHDYLYKTGNAYGDGTRKQADDIFLEAMEVLGVPRYKRYPIYLAVRMFGAKHFASLPASTQ